MNQNLKSRHISKNSSFYTCQSLMNQGHSPGTSKIIDLKQMEKNLKSHKLDFEGTQENFGPWTDLKESGHHQLRRPNTTNKVKPAQDQARELQYQYYIQKIHRLNKTLDGGDKGEDQLPEFYINDNTKYFMRQIPPSNMRSSTNQLSNDIPQANSSATPVRAKTRLEQVNKMAPLKIQESSPSLNKTAYNEFSNEWKSYSTGYKTNPLRLMRPYYINQQSTQRKLAKNNTNMNLQNE